MYNSPKQEINKFLDVTELNKFLDILEYTDDYENYYIFLQNRKKYGANKDILKSRDILKKEDILNKLTEYVTINSDHESSVNYIKINKCFSKYAISDFIKEMTEELVENKNPAKIDKSINILKSCFHNCKSKRTFIDIDFDIPKVNYDLVKSFTDELTNNNVTYYIIETRGGYHVLILVKTIKYNWTTTLEKVNVAARNILTDKFEIVLNKHCTVPIPGTYQGGFLVKML